jgi:hypothetical protein
VAAYVVRRSYAARFGGATARGGLEVGSAFEGSCPWRSAHGFNRQRNSGRRKTRASKTFRAKDSTAKIREQRHLAIDSSTREIFRRRTRARSDGENLIHR